MLELSDDAEKAEAEKAGSDSDLSIVEIQNPAPRHSDERDSIRIFDNLMDLKPFVVEARKHYAALITDRFSKFFAFVDVIELTIPQKQLVTSTRASTGWALPVTTRNGLTQASFPWLKTRLVRYPRSAPQNSSRRIS